MVDLRIDVIRPSGQHDAMLSGLLQVIQNPLPFRINRLPCAVQLRPCR